MKLVPGHVICACSWHGELAAKARCPSCDRPPTDRMDTGRIAVLRRVQVEPDADLQPRTMPLRLIAIGVLRRDGPKIQPSEVRRRTAPRRRHAVTNLGLDVLAVADQLEREQQQRREYVAAAAARHCDLPDD